MEDVLQHSLVPSRRFKGVAQVLFVSGISLHPACHPGTEAALKQQVLLPRSGVLRL